MRHFFRSRSWSRTLPVSVLKPKLRLVSDKFLRSPSWSWTRTSHSRLQSRQTLLKDLQQLRKNKMVIIICCFFLSILIFYKYLFNFFISEATTDEKHDSLLINQETPYDITQVPFPLGNLELKTFLNKELEEKICRKIEVTVNN